MENNTYLNEEKYQKNKKTISKFALIVLIVGILIGVSLIATGLLKQGKINDKYYESNKAQQAQKLEDEKKKITEDIEAEKQKVIASKTELEAKIKPVEEEIKSLEREKFTGLDDAYYARKDKIEELEKSIAEDKKSIDTIKNALDDSFDHCAFAAAKNNTYTSKYCSLKNQLKQKNSEISNLDNEYSDFNKRFDSHGSIPFYMFGAFVIIASCMIAGSIFMFTKRREILAFQAQQIMPVAQEGIDKMSPTLGKAAGTIAKGIKEGLKDEDNKWLKK